MEITTTTWYCKTKSTKCYPGVQWRRRSDSNMASGPRGHHGRTMRTTHTWSGSPETNIILGINRNIKPEKCLEMSRRKQRTTNSPASNTELKHQITLQYYLLLFHNVRSQHLSARFVPRTLSARARDLIIPHHPIVRKTLEPKCQNQVCLCTCTVVTSTTPLRKRTNQPRKRQRKLTYLTWPWKRMTYPAHISVMWRTGHPHTRSRQDPQKKTCPGCAWESTKNRCILIPLSMTCTHRVCPNHGKEIGIVSVSMHIMWGRQQVHQGDRGSVGCGDKGTHKLHQTEWNQEHREETKWGRGRIKREEQNHSNGLTGKRKLSPQIQGP